MSDSDDFHSADEGEADVASAVVLKSTDTSETTARKKELTGVTSDLDSHLLKTEVKPCKDKNASQGKKGRKNKRTKGKNERSKEDKSKTQVSVKELASVELVDNDEPISEECASTKEISVKDESITDEVKSKKTIEKQVSDLNLESNVQEDLPEDEQESPPTQESYKLPHDNEGQKTPTDKSLQAKTEATSNSVERASCSDSEKTGEIVTTTSDVKAEFISEKPNESRSIASLFESSHTKEKTTPPQHDSREENILEKLSMGSSSKSSGWGSGWGSWGSNILSTASSSLHTFSGQVSEGVHTVVESFEATIGAPPPDQLDEDLSNFIKEPEEVVVDHEPTEEPKVTSEVLEENAEAQLDLEAAGQGDSDWLSQWGVTNISSALQSKTKSIVESSLDVLETIGKKTVETIKERDPGFKKTKSLLHGNKTNLSQILREAKEETDKQAALERESCADSLANYSTLFDQYQGLAHLEALEMLSISCTADIDNKEQHEEEMPDIIEKLSEKFSMVCVSDDETEDHDFSSAAADSVLSLAISMSADKLIKVQTGARSWIEKCAVDQQGGERIEGRDIHDFALQSFAQLTSAVMELFHKSGELILLPNPDGVEIDEESRADHFIDIMKLVCTEMNLQASKYNECLDTAADDSENPDSISPMITNVFLECSNSVSYVQDGFKLLLPVLQKSAITSLDAR